ncbi:MAG: CHASE3 domain-containing protein [Chitinophagaceae bacterium]
MKYVTNKVMSLAIIVIALVIAMVLFISIRQSQQVGDTADTVARTEEIRLHSEQLILSVLDNETGARGFVITGQHQFLEPLKRSEIKLKQELSTLLNLIQDSVSHRLIRDSLSYYINKRTTFSQEMVTTREQKGVGEATLLVLTGSDKFYTDKIRSLSDDLRQRLIVLLNVRRKANQLTVKNLNIVLYSVISAVFILSIVIIYSTQADLKRRRLNEERFKSLLDAAPDATLIVNAKGIIQLTNQQTERLFGYNNADMIGKPVELLIPTGLPGKSSVNVNGHVHGVAASANVELNAKKRNGSIFPVEISLSPIQTNEGVLVSTSLRDITLRKKLENDLKKSNAEMEAFTYSVSHDLRAPLRGIVGFTAILEDEYTSKLDAEANRLTGIIKSNTLKMGHLIDDLLTFSRMGRQDMLKTDTDIQVMVNEIVEEVRQQPNGDRVEWVIHPLPEAKVDINTLRQVWINLISNAVKYTGKVTQPHIEIGSYAEGDSVVFFVKDNGVGFDEQYSNKLFKVFQRLHSEQEFEGTGVGLALVEKIVSKHGGNVWANAKVNEGANFYFSIPVN